MGDLGAMIKIMFAMAVITLIGGIIVVGWPVLILLALAGVGFAVYRQQRKRAKNMV
jgi:hypothetical protein